MNPLGMSDLLILIGQKEVELALLRQQIAVLTDQVRQLTPKPADAQGAATTETEPR